MCQAYEGEHRAYVAEEKRAKPCHWCGRPAVYAPPFDPVRCNKCHSELIAKDHPWKYGKDGLPRL